MGDAEEVTAVLCHKCGKAIPPEQQTEDERQLCRECCVAHLTALGWWRDGRMHDTRPR